MISSTILFLSIIPAIFAITWDQLIPLFSLFQGCQGAFGVITKNQLHFERTTGFFGVFPVITNTQGHPKTKRGSWGSFGI